MLPRGIGELVALKRLTLVLLQLLDEWMQWPDLARLTVLQELTVSTCALTALPRGICELEVLKSLTMASLYYLEEVPDLARLTSRLTSLQELMIEECDELMLLSGIIELEARKRLTLVSLYLLKKVPDLSRVTSLQELTISECEERGLQLFVSASGDP
jgi:sulfur relay (sulfurtransferase) complex TusBCD TusD component (DsrE family)